MTMPVLVSVLSALLAQASGTGASRTAWVSAEEVLVLAEPDVGAFVTGRLKKGDRVLVRRESPRGWFAIEPPTGAFSWVPREAVEETQNGRARVMVRAVAVRPGSTSARMPGGTWTTLALGAQLRLVDRPPLVLRRVGESARVWLAVEPPEGELRYVRADSVSPLDPRTLAEADDSQRFDLFASAPSAGESGRLSIQASRRVGPIDPAFASVGPPLPEAGLTSRFAAQVQSVESAHRSVLVRSMETWRLEDVRAAYQTLLDQSATPQERSAVQARLAQVDRQASAAEAIRRAETILSRSHQVDADVMAVESRLETLSAGAGAPFDARGLFHHTSMLVSGQRIYVLFDDRGLISAYLRIPPGLDARSRLGHRVGVRGEAHYDESLRGRLIDVRDLVPLDEAP